MLPVLVLQLLHLLSCDTYKISTHKRFTLLAVNVSIVFSQYNKQGKEFRQSILLDAYDIAPQEQHQICLESYNYVENASYDQG